jgi:hypothetical protein
MLSERFLVRSRDSTWSFACASRRRGEPSGAWISLDDAGVAGARFKSADAGTGILTPSPYSSNPRSNKPYNERRELRDRHPRGASASGALSVSLGCPVRMDLFCVRLLKILSSTVFVIIYPQTLFSPRRLDAHGQPVDGHPTQERRRLGVGVHCPGCAHTREARRARHRSVCLLRRVPNAF